MLEIGMHKHIGDQLIKFEVGSHKKMQAQNFTQFYTISLSHDVSKEAEDINNKQILCYCG